MFTVKNINFILALIFIFCIINLFIVILFKSEIVNFINSVFKSKYNRDLNWRINNNMLIKSVTTLTITYIVIIIILANKSSSIANCVNKSFSFVQNDTIKSILNIPLSKLSCIFGGIFIIYIIFFIIIISISKINIYDTALNTDIRGFGSSIENFVSKKVEGLETQKEPSETVNINSDNFYPVNNSRPHIKYNSKLSEFIEKIGSIVFADKFESKPECCEVNKNLSTGCLCVDQQSIDNMNKRFNNNTDDNNFLNSFVDFGYTNESNADGETLT